MRTKALCIAFELIKRELRQPEIEGLYIYKYICFLSDFLERSIIFVSMDRFATLMNFDLWMMFKISGNRASWFLHSLNDFLWNLEWECYLENLIFSLWSVWCQETLGKEITTCNIWVSFPVTSLLLEHQRLVKKFNMRGVLPSWSPGSIVNLYINIYLFIYTCSFLMFVLAGVD